MRSRSLRLFAVGTAFVLGLATLAACGGDDDDQSAASTTSTTRKRTTTTVAAEEAPIAPLTGLPDTTGASSGRGALSVKVDNVPLARRPPQAGIDVADIVYEEPVEGATRFLAIFHSTLPPRIGPVRSTRFLDPGIVWALGGLYVYSGGTPPKVQAIQSAPIQTVDENGMQAADARIRDSNFGAPHNLFVVPDKLWAWEGVQDRTPPEPLFEYAGATEPATGDPASKIEIPTFSDATYTWDAAGGTWKREELIDGTGRIKPHVAESGPRSRRRTSSCRSSRASATAPPTATSSRAPVRCGCSRKARCGTAPGRAPTSTPRRRRSPTTPANPFASRRGRRG
jgi:hypothetical protein